MGLNSKSFLSMLLGLAWTRSSCFFINRPSPPRFRSVCTSTFETLARSADRENATLRKLRVLQDVVKELQLRNEKSTVRDAQHRDKVRGLERDLKDAIDEHQRNTEVLKKSLTSKTRLHNEKIDAITQKLEKRCAEALELCSTHKAVREACEQELSKVQADLSRSKREYEFLNESKKSIELKKGEETSVLRNRIAELEVELHESKEKVEVLSKRSEDEAILHKKDEAITTAKGLIAEYEEEQSSLKAEVSHLTELHTQREESLEIANAAVRNARRRESDTMLKWEQSQKSYKQAKAFLKLQQVTLKALAEDRLRHVEQNEKLKEHLLACEEKKNRNDSNILKRLFFRGSRRLKQPEA